MDILKLSTDWARAEVFSAKITLFLGVLFLIAAFGFWQMGKTPMAKAFLWPMLVAGVLIVAVSAGLYFTNKPRIAQFEAAYHTDAKAFVQTEAQRTAKSQRELAVVFKVLPLIVIAATLVIMLINIPLWRAIGITTIALMIVLLFIDSNTNARNAVYHEHLSAEQQ